MRWFHRPRLVWLLSVALWSAAAAGVAVTALGWLASWWWVAALFEHFRVQAAVLLGATALAGFAFRRWPVSGLAAAGALVNLIAISPSWSAPSAPPNTQPRISVVLLNVQQDSDSYQRVARFLVDTDADVIGLVEVDSRWLAELAPVTQRWPHAVLEPRDRDRFGLALFSKYPLRDGGAHTFGGAWPPALVATLDAFGDAIAFVLVHPPPPVRAEMASVQADFFDALAAARPGLGENLVVLGDFNATPWSHALRQLRERTGLRDSREGFGIQASWPTATPLLRIPIDHVLVSDDLMVLARQVGPALGSDHFPVRATLAISRP